MENCITKQFLYFLTEKIPRYNRLLIKIKCTKVGNGGNSMLNISFEKQKLKIIVFRLGSIYNISEILYYTRNIKIFEIPQSKVSLLVLYLICKCKRTLCFSWRPASKLSFCTEQRFGQSLPVQNWKGSDTAYLYSLANQNLYVLCLIKESEKYMKTRLTSDWLSRSATSEMEYN